MKKCEVDILAAPKSLLPLSYRKGVLTDSENRIYKLFNGIPLLLTDDNSTIWHRELMEVILWQYPDELEKMYERIPKGADPNPEYIRTIKRLLVDKKGVQAALDEYVKADTDRWIAKQALSDDAMKNSFKRLSSYSTGRKRVKTKRYPSDTKIYERYKLFSDTCLKNKPERIVELATGAGGGTASLAINMSKKARLYTVDISPLCLANAIGIAKYTHRKNIFPICANFWHLPFKSESVELVCTFCGLDESRENDKTLSETCRILKSGGSFVCVSRKNSFMRQATILESFGFSKNEGEEYMKKCRLYSSFEDLKKQCAASGLSFVSSQEIDNGDNTIFVVSEFKKQT